MPIPATNIAHCKSRVISVEQLNCLNRAVEYVQLTQDLEVRFMAAVKKMKQAFSLCSSSEQFTSADIEKVHFYQAVRSILFKLTKGDAPDTSQMNAKVRKLLDEAIQSDGGTDRKSTQ